MSEFWTKTCERCGKIFDVNLWTCETDYCGTCELKEDVDPSSDSLELNRSGLSDNWRDISALTEAGDDVDRSHGYIKEDHDWVIGNSDNRKIMKERG